jgi:hypothetical protein
MPVFLPRFLQLQTSLIAASWPDVRDEITTGERYQDPQQEAEWLKAVYGPRVKIVLRV